MITAEKKEKLEGLIGQVSTGELSIEQMDALDSIKSLIAEEEDIDAKYREMETGYTALAEENARVIDAYRKRWDESNVGTMVNGGFVDKTVTDVSYGTYEDLINSAKEG